VTEAGGLIGNFTGEADFLEQKECLAASPRIYGQLVPLLGKYSKFASAGEKAALRQAGERPATAEEADETKTSEEPETPPAQDGESA